MISDDLLRQDDGAQRHTWNVPGGTYEVCIEVNDTTVLDGGPWAVWRRMYDLGGNVIWWRKRAYATIHEARGWAWQHGRRVEARLAELNARPSPA